ncbi:MAG: Phage SPO1 DNA polymerase-related protein [candidate division Kazan bacterium GW2011_GWB1_45_10]|uniref:Type-4 uracil-DNA glycosylase n=1 Tax=candidate division Kazan bacterium GW2011_GWB1_45_10 TaxID=1620411 RepID=A0A0G1NSY1_UNCK3|nr:MAG: Phage SPO1 DNA polymerase-related protein [candidate division Kazan bacterium GW2011_GWB1_45_10]
MEDRSIALQAITTDIKQHQCSLRRGCIQAVPGEGNPNSPVVFIGEGPGRVEDEEGRPFVGPAGKLLTNLLESVGWQRSDVYITNVVKCRPPENRDPLPEEVEEHKEFLQRELDLIQPKLIVLLGRHALHWFLPDEKISQCKGRAKRKGDRVYFPIYHPAAALHNPNLASTLKEDFLKIPAVLRKIAELPVVPSPTPLRAEVKSASKQQLSIF